MRRITRASVLIVALVFLLTSCGFGKIRLGTADAGGRYYTFGAEYALCVLEKPGKEMDVKETAGSAANLRLLSEGYLDLGIAQSDLVADALAGTGAYEGKALKGISAIAGLYAESCQIIVRADSGISDIDDLIGRTVSIGEKESGTEYTASRILQAYGLAAGKAALKNCDYAEAAAALESGKIDAAFCIAGSAVESFAALAERVPLRLLPVDGREASTLLRSFSCFEKTLIPEGLYKGQSEEVESLSVRAILLASDKLDTATVKGLTEAVFTNAGRLGLDLSRDLDLRFHPGAEAYFEEAGLLPADREGGQK